MMDSEEIEAKLVPVELIPRSKYDPILFKFMELNHKYCRVEANIEKSALLRGLKARIVDQYLTEKIKALRGADEEIYLENLKLRE